MRVTGLSTVTAHLLPTPERAPTGSGTGRADAEAGFYADRQVARGPGSRVAATGGHSRRGASPERFLLFFFFCWQWHRCRDTPEMPVLALVLVRTKMALQVNTVDTGKIRVAPHRCFATWQSRPQSVHKVKYQSLERKGGTTLRTLSSAAGITCGSGALSRLRESARLFDKPGMWRTDSIREWRSHLPTRTRAWRLGPPLPPMRGGRLSPRDT